jgi:hypothetical protein
MRSQDCAKVHSLTKNKSHAQSRLHEKCIHSPKNKGHAQSRLHESSFLDQKTKHKNKTQKNIKVMRSQDFTKSSFIDQKKRSCAVKIARKVHSLTKQKGHAQSRLHEQFIH